MRKITKKEILKERKAISMHVRKVRLDNIIQQKELAYDLKISRPNIARFEFAHLNYSIITLLKICNYLKIDIMLESNHDSITINSSDCCTTVQRDLMAYFTCTVRQDKGISQIELAEAVGVKHPDISRFEFAKVNYKIDFLIKICKALNIEIILK